MIPSAEHQGERTKSYKSAPGEPDALFLFVRSPSHESTEERSGQ